MHLYPDPDKEGKVKNENYSPQSIKQILGQLNPIYNSNNKRNPNELLSFILNQLHKELNVANNDTSKILNPNNFDKQTAIKNGFNNFKMFYNSIISKNLNWFEIKQSMCKSCNNKLFHFNTFNIFELDILRTYNIKKKPVLTLLDCLDFYSSNKTQIFICKNCGKKTEIIIQSKIYSTPNIFIFSLDRQNLDNKFLKIPFIINEEINIYNFLEEKMVPSQYKLIGILSYWMNQQKYISFCMSPFDNEWYIYNDEKIEKIQIKNIINNNQLIPCILVYKSNLFL